MIYFLRMPKKYAILHHWGSSVHQSVAESNLIKQVFCELELVGHLGLALQCLQFAFLRQVYAVLCLQSDPSGVHTYPQEPNRMLGCHGLR